MASTVPDPDVQSMIALVRALTNNQLKSILRTENLTVSGVKLVLQRRAINRSSSTQVHLYFLRYEPSHIRRSLLTPAIVAAE
jgi:hypothetical protein